MDEPQIHTTTADFCSALWNNLIILDLRGEIRKSDVAASIAMWQAALAQNPRGIASLTLLQSSSKISTAETRAEMAEGFRVISERLLVSVVVMENNSLVGQLMRTVARGMNVVSGNERNVFAKNFDEAIELLLPRVTTKGSRSELEPDLRRAVAIVRRHFSNAPRPSLPDPQHQQR